ncbi:MAG: hypothetical protein QOK88_02680 [Nitrososphaeraceae archaeon]|nr:hypothetical protein [Nitrososphaeraceae archaeon]MDW0154845.1 hypothetical protein [Nitrososphaeraceae archaeon]
MTEDNSEDSFDKVKKGLKETAEGIKEGVEDTAEGIKEGVEETARESTDSYTKLYENDLNANLTEEERKAKAAREAANRDKDNESPNHREAALNRKRNTLNDQNANSNQQETYRQSV